MNHKKIVLLIILALVALLGFAVFMTASAVSGAAFTTFNAHVDGAGKDVCKNSAINCNIYGAKEYVWLNGGPTANGLGPDGQYFFAVLVPGGQPNPNDGGPKNLSDDYDAYTNRTFTVTVGEVSADSGTHWLDSGQNEPGPGDPKPNDVPPYIRLFPYADTTNPGGVYILAICSLKDGYPVDPRDCKYDAFKVKKGRVVVNFMLNGMKFEDMNANGSKDSDDLGLEGWEITITGTGPNGIPINDTITTDPDGFWDWTSLDYTFSGGAQPGPVALQVCEVQQDGWYQSYPSGTGCHTVDFTPSGFESFFDLDFGNFQPVSVSAVKFFDRNLNGFYEAGESFVSGFEFCLKDASYTLVSADDFVADPQTACQSTGEDGTAIWSGLFPGTYTVEEGDNPDYWHPIGPTSYTFTLLSSDFKTVFFGNVVNCVGLTPGYWVNWRNHYSDTEFLTLLPGTIADSIADADRLLTATGCDGEDAINCLRRFILANQLTLNLTASDLAFQPGEMYPICELYSYPDIPGNVGYWLDEALTIHASGGVGYEREYILYVKTILDLFANQIFVFP